MEVLGDRSKVHSLEFSLERGKTRLGTIEGRLEGI